MNMKWFARFTVIAAALAMPLMMGGCEEEAELETPTGEVEIEEP